MILERLLDLLVGVVSFCGECFAALKLERQLVGTPGVGIRRQILAWARIAMLYAIPLVVLPIPVVAIICLQDVDTSIIAPLINQVRYVVASAALSVVTVGAAIFVPCAMMNFIIRDNEE